MAKPIISIEQVSKKIGNKLILDRLHLDIAQGETIGLIGANGAGKTTLFSLLSTISSPTAGDIKIQGYSVRTQSKQAKQFIGYVPQEIALYQSLSVRDNLEFWANLIITPVSPARITEVAEHLGLTKYLHERVEHLSGGYKRRVNMAVAFLSNPPILLLDEPTVGVDIYAKKEIWPLLKSWKKEGRTLIYSSHDREEIISLADRVVMLAKGKIVFEGSIDKAKQELDILQR